MRMFDQKKFVRSVLQQRPNWSALGNMFYLSPADHVLAGVGYERVPDGGYIWRYAYPLYDPIRFFHLSYGERLPVPEGFIGDDDIGEGELADEFLKRTEIVERGLSNTSTVDGVIGLLTRKIEAGLPIARLARAASYIMAMNEVRASEDLQAIQATNGYGILGDAKKALPLLEAAFARSIGEARRLLLEWEESFCRTNGVNRGTI